MADVNVLEGLDFDPNDRLVEGGDKINLDDFLNEYDIEEQPTSKASQPLIAAPDFEDMMAFGETEDIRFLGMSSGASSHKSSQNKSSQSSQSSLSEKRKRLIPGSATPGGHTPEAVLERAVGTIGEGLENALVCINPPNPQVSTQRNKDIVKKSRKEDKISRINQKGKHFAMKSTGGRLTREILRQPFRQMKLQELEGVIVFQRGSRAPCPIGSPIPSTSGAPSPTASQACSSKRPVNNLEAKSLFQQQSTPDSTSSLGFRLPDKPKSSSASSSSSESWSTPPSSPVTSKSLENDVDEATVVPEREVQDKELMPPPKTRLEMKRQTTSKKSSVTPIKRTTTPTTANSIPDSSKKTARKTGISPYARPSTFATRVWSETVSSTHRGSQGIGRGKCGVTADRIQRQHQRSSDTDFESSSQESSQSSQSSSESTSSTDTLRSPAVGKNRRFSKGVPEKRVSSASKSQEKKIQFNKNRGRKETTSKRVSPNQSRKADQTQSRRWNASGRKASAATRKLREIKKIMGDNLQITKAPFARLVKHIMQNLNGMPQAENMRLTPEALNAMQEVSEAFTSRLFEDSHLAANHAKRVTVMPKDMQLVLRLRNFEKKNDLSNRNLDRKALKLQQLVIHP